MANKYDKILGAYRESDVVSGTTSGGVVFGSPAGGITQDSTNLFWDNTNDRLGIGTASPSDRLNLSGATVGMRITDTNGYYYTIKTDGGGGRLLVALNGSATSAIAVNSSNNVGIGINAPTSKLHVVGNTFLNGNVAVNGTAIQSNIGLISAAQVNDPTALQTGASFSRTLNITAANSQVITGGEFNVSTLGNNFAHSGKVRGGYFSVQNSNINTVSDVRGGDFLLYQVGAGTITDGHAGYFGMQNLVAGGNITRAYGSRVELIFNNGTIATTYGYYVGDITSGTQTNQAYGFYMSDANARNFFAGNTGFGTNAPSTVLDINADKFRVRTAKTPATATDTGNAGDICWDANYVYVCTAANTWKRSAIATW